MSTHMERAGEAIKARLIGKSTSSGKLYLAVRHMLKLSQKQMAAILGMTQPAIVRRENERGKYSLEELRDLRKFAGMSKEDWVTMYESLANE